MPYKCVQELAELTGRKAHRDTVGSQLHTPRLSHTGLRPVSISDVTDDGAERLHCSQ